MNKNKTNIWVQSSFQDIPHGCLSGGSRRVCSARMQRCSMETTLSDRLHVICTSPPCYAQTQLQEKHSLLSINYHLYVFMWNKNTISGEYIYSVLSEQLLLSVAAYKHARLCKSPGHDWPVSYKAKEATTLSLTMGLQHTPLHFFVWVSEHLWWLMDQWSSLFWQLVYRNKVMSCSSSSRGSSLPCWPLITDLYSHDAVNSLFVLRNVHFLMDHRTSHSHLTVFCKSWMCS